MINHDSTARSQKRRRVSQQHGKTVACQGVYRGNFGSALKFAAKTMINTAHWLFRIAKELDFSLASFEASALAKSHDFFLPHYRMIMKRANNAKDGFNFYSVECTCSTVAMGRSNKIQECKACSRNEHKLTVHVRKLNEPIVERPGRSLPIECITNNPTKARLEIEALRKENKELRKQNAKKSIQIKS